MEFFVSLVILACAFGAGVAVGAQNGAKIKALEARVAAAEAKIRAKL